ncbi:MAG: DUF1501 domain-containing protein [Actinomycetota bacterium]|nr:DUF1501 domain-containing protein [Actinomycetota bacterium]
MTAEIPGGELDCCSGSGTSRRRFLAGMAALAGAGLLDVGGAQYAFAAGPRTRGDLLVVVSLRGGADGLSLVPPLADPGYLAARPSIGIPARTALPLDRSFGLHPRMAPLMPFWHQGQLAFVQAVGDADGSRSHFEATDNMERGTDADLQLGTGWLDRHLDSRGVRGTDFPALAIGGTTPVSLRGPAPALSLWSVADARVHCPPALAVGVERALNGMYDGVAGPVGEAGRVTLDALRRLAPFRDHAYVPRSGTTYPSNGLGYELSQVAQVAKAGVGLEVACVEYGGWDTHTAMGVPTSGAMADLVGGFASALAAFATDLGPLLRTTTIVTLTEFGRRVAENASNGVDHGHGGVMLALGGGIRGGRVYGRWPGLAPKDLEQGDLQATTDYRDVLAEVVRRRLGNARVDQVFPGHRARELGLTVGR